MNRYAATLAATFLLAGCPDNNQITAPNANDKQTLADKIITQQSAPEDVVKCFLNELYNRQDLGLARTYIGKITPAIEKQFESYTRFMTDPRNRLQAEQYKKAMHEVRLREASGGVIASVKTILPDGRIISDDNLCTIEKRDKQWVITDLDF